MRFSYPKDKEDDHINKSDHAPDERDNIKQLSAVGITNGAEGCLVPLVVPSDNHETEVNDSTDDEKDDGLLEG